MAKKGAVIYDTIAMVLLVVVAGLGIWAYYSATAQKEIKEYKIEIGQKDTVAFITQEYVKQQINSNLKGVVSTIGATNVNAVEAFFDSVEYVRDVEVYKSSDGILSINIEQCIPQFRIVTSGGKNVYIDGSMRVLPPSENFVADVPVVTISDSMLNIVISFENNSKITSKNYNFADNLLNFVVKVGGDSFWNNFIAQININDRAEVELVPRVGAHIVIFCDVSDLGKYMQYLEKLYLTYFKEISKVGWNKYRVINVKYDKLVVCTK